MGKFIVFMISLVIALIPTWLWLGVYHFLSPEGFWQKFILLGAGIALLGGFQIILLALWIAFLVKVFRQ